jgi:hypothetical protein
VVSFVADWHFHFFILRILGMERALTYSHKAISLGFHAAGVGRAQMAPRLRLPKKTKRQVEHAYMQNSKRLQLRDWLLGTSRRNPQLIVSQYCAVRGLASGAPYPRHLTVNEMIECILDNEDSDSASSGVLRAIAG